MGRVSVVGNEVYVVVEDEYGEDLSVLVYDSEDKARVSYTEKVEEYKKDLVELGSGGITDTWADIADRFDEGVALVYWERREIY